MVLNKYRRTGGKLMGIAEKTNSIVERFTKFSDWEDKYKEIIKLGKDLPDMPNEYMVDGNKVQGCQSQVWLYPDMKAGVESLKFYATSDALIAKGLIALVLKVYNGSSAQEIMTTPPEFINEIGLQNHLSPNRSNGLQAMVKQIKIYAYALTMKNS